MTSLLRFVPCSVVVGGLALSALSGGVAFAQTVAVSRTINFDTFQNGTPIPDGTAVNNTFANLGVTFTGQGTFGNQVAVSRTVSVSAPNSLDATNGTITVLFPTAYFPGGVNFFQITNVVDPQGFGSTNTSAQFYDRNNTLLLNLTGINQTTQNTITVSTLTSIQRVVLPADTYYDNLVFRGNAAAPEPGSVALVGMGLLGMAGTWVRRRRPVR